MDSEIILRIAELRSFVKYKGELYILNIPINLINCDGVEYLNSPEINLVKTLNIEKGKKYFTLDEIIDRNICRSVGEFLKLLYVEIGSDDITYSDLSRIYISLMSGNQSDINFRMNLIFSESFYLLNATPTLTDTIEKVFPGLKFIHWNYINTIKNEKL